MNFVTRRGPETVFTVAHDGESLVLFQGPEVDQITHIVKTDEEFNAMLDEVGSVACSSTLDYPEETLASDVIIELCHLIREGLETALPSSSIAQTGDSITTDYLNFATTREICSRLVYVATYIVKHIHDGFIHRQVLDERDVLIAALSRRI